MSNENPFASEAQNGIFNFFFVLVQEYAKTMTPPEAFAKAIAWMESFCEDMKQKHSDMITQREKLEKRMQQQH